MEKILFKFNGHIFREEPLRPIVLREMHNIVVEHHATNPSKKGKYTVTATDGSTSQKLYDITDTDLDIMKEMRGSS